MNPDEQQHSFQQNLPLIIWIGLLIMELLILAFGIPESFATLLQPCSGPAAECQLHMQLTPAEATLWSLDAYAWYTITTRGLARLVSLLLGVLIFIKKPNSRIAWITSVYLIVGVETGIADTLAFTHPVLLPMILLTQLVGINCLFLFFLLFPDDRFDPRWTWKLFWVFMLISVLNVGITQILIRGDLDVQTTSQLDDLRMVFGLALLGVILILVGIFVYRYRTVFTYTERQKTKWVIYAFVLGYGIFVGFILLSLLLGWEDSPKPPLLYVAEDIFVFGIIDYLIPVAMAIAILRYRLFDIDLIIRKTLQYAMLTAVLVLVYSGSVLLLQSLVERVTGDQSPIVIVASTLGIAALFTPLRTRIQEFIDRRFYRNKYDAEQALAQFSATTRNDVDFERISTALLAVVEETVKPEISELRIISSTDRKP